MLDHGGRAGSKRWRVTVDGKEKARFSKLEEAVEAVDFEVGQRGPASVESARPSAAWRRAPVPEALRQRLSALQPPQTAKNHGDALRLLAWASHAPRR